jgi:hypothetical protein
LSGCVEPGERCCRQVDQGAVSGENFIAAKLKSSNDARISNAVIMDLAAEVAKGNLLNLCNKKLYFVDARALESLICEIARCCGKRK